MDKPNFKSATNEELQAYIEYQDGLLNGVNSLEQQVSRTCSILSADIEKINSGKTEGLIILCLDDNILKKLMFTIKNKDLFMGKNSSAISKPVKTPDHESAEIEKLSEIIGNPFELMSEKVKLNGKR